MRNLTFAIAHASVTGTSVSEALELFHHSLLSFPTHMHTHTHTGSGSTAIFGQELFEKRMEIVKELKVAEQALEVLYGLQIAVAELQHPPSE